MLPRWKHIILELLTESWIPVADISFKIYILTLGCITPPVFTKEPPTIFGLVLQNKARHQMVT